MNATNDSTWFGDSTLEERFPAWTRGNAADVFPEPFSPLGQTLVMRKGMCTGLRDAYISIGALNYDEFVDPPLPDLFKVFGGYPYNPLSMTRVLGARMPGVTPELIDQAFFLYVDIVTANNRCQLIALAARTDQTSVNGDPHAVALENLGIGDMVQSTHFRCEEALGADNFKR